MGESEDLHTEVLYDEARRVEVKITFAKADTSCLIAASEQEKENMLKDLKNTQKICLGVTNRSQPEWDDAMKKSILTTLRTGGFLYEDALSDHLISNKWLVKKP